jgi:hypothetical protein
MKHQTIEQLQTLAEVNPHLPREPMTRTERLARWAELLDRDPKRCLRTLHGTEYSPAETRTAMRALGSPITVAFEDPQLRAEGMKDDTYGEAISFFELTDRQLHRIVCHCHFGETVTSATAAQSVRLATVSRRSPFAWLRQALFG